MVERGDYKTLPAKLRTNLGEVGQVKPNYTDLKVLKPQQLGLSVRVHKMKKE